MNNYYTLARLGERLTDELIVATPTDKKGWSYLIADDNWDWVKIETNSQYRITNVSFTHKYKGLGMSLKRAQTKWRKLCRHPGVASWNWKLRNVN